MYISNNEIYSNIINEILYVIEKNRMNEAQFDICTATTEKTGKVVHEKKCMLSNYGTSCFR